MRGSSPSSRSEDDCVGMSMRIVCFELIVCVVVVVMAWKAEVGCCRLAITPEAARSRPQRRRQRTEHSLSLALEGGGPLLLPLARCALRVGACKCLIGFAKGKNDDCVVKATVGSSESSDTTRVETHRVAPSERRREADDFCLSLLVHPPLLRSIHAGRATCRP